MERLAQAKHGSIFMAASKTLERRRKDSFYWYKHVIETNGADLDTL